MEAHSLDDNKTIVGSQRTEHNCGIGNRTQTPRQGGREMEHALVTAKLRAGKDPKRRALWWKGNARPTPSSWVYWNKR